MCAPRASAWSVIHMLYLRTLVPKAHNRIRKEIAVLIAARRTTGPHASVCDQHVNGARLLPLRAG